MAKSQIKINFDQPSIEAESLNASNNNDDLMWPASNAMAASDITDDLNAAIIAHDEPLNQSELKAVTSVISYVAYSQNASEQIVCEMLATAFEVKDVKALPRGYYDEAIRYLVDLRVQDVMN